MVVSEAVVELTGLENPDVEPASADVLALLFSGSMLASDALETGDPAGPGVRLLVPPSGAPLGETRPKLDADEPTEGPDSVPAPERESVELVVELIELDEPIVLEGVAERSGLRPGRHGLRGAIVVAPAGRCVVVGVTGGS